MYTFQDLIEITAKLRSEGGCPWDRAQTHESLKPYLAEEAGEVLQAIDSKDMENLCEELGDVLLQVVLHAQIAREEGIFTLEDVVQGISEKMIRRHPHVFGTGHVQDAREVVKSWEEIKQEEKAGKHRPVNPLEEVPAAFPALIRAVKVQKKLEKLHGELYRYRIPVVLGFEGWDAGGKGGAIKRLTQRMDPRGYVVHPTASPNDIERAHHYLWRFWTDMPKAGHVTIFDRTWYGRVMVERIEGFCTRQEWQRAYREINDMEKDLTEAGAVVLKFWMQIDKEEQARRFQARQENPEKQWKITDEDWRNREKWDQYEEAVNEMLIRTSSPYAPWIVVEGNCKYYARIKVLETVVEAVEKKLEEKKQEKKRQEEKKGQK